MDTGNSTETYMWINSEVISVMNFCIVCLELRASSYGLKSTCLPPYCCCCRGCSELLAIAVKPAAAHGRVFRTRTGFSILSHISPLNGWFEELLVNRFWTSEDKWVLWKHFPRGFKWAPTCAPTHGTKTELTQNPGYFISFYFIDLKGHSNLEEWCVFLFLWINHSNVLQYIVAVEMFICLLNVCYKGYSEV